MTEGWISTGTESCAADVFGIERCCDKAEPQAKIKQMPTLESIMKPVLFNGLIT